MKINKYLPEHIAKWWGNLPDKRRAKVRGINMLAKHVDIIAAYESERQNQLHYLSLPETKSILAELKDINGKEEQEDNSSKEGNLFSHEGEIRYPVKTHANPKESPYKLSNAAFVYGCQFGYDLLKQENERLKAVNAELLGLQNSFYMDICRAFNAGKQAMNDQHSAHKEGKPDCFKSSHDYFIGEFPAFTTNVP